MAVINREFYVNKLNELKNQIDEKLFRVLWQNVYFYWKE